MSDLLAELLAKPIGPAIAGRKAEVEDFTKKIEVRENVATVTLRGEPDEVTEDAASDFLRDKGLNPDDWIVTGFSGSEWGDGLESRRFTFKPRSCASGTTPLPIDEIVSQIASYAPVEVRAQGDHGFLVLIADTQFFKTDGDGVEGTVRRTIQCINKAADALLQYRKLYAIGHVHIAWLGDHIEGFVSQGGANVWRTNGTLTEQIRLTRRVMLHALLTFAPLANRVTMASVPGNHDQAVRIDGKGVTRYDDSHDVESLIAVADAAALAPEKFGHVEFFVPANDELTVLVEVAGTKVAHAHGHQWRPLKHFDWWKGQAFNRDSAMHVADLLVAGHLHHEFVDTDGDRTFIQPPAMESESTWFRHSTGTGGAPGLIVALTKGGNTNLKELIRA